MTNPQFEIHPFNEVFYIKSLLNKTRAIMQDVESLNDIWKNENHDCKNDDVILDILQNIILNAGGVSRFFWSPKNNGYYKIRSEKLRKVYNMNDSSVLKNREMRNSIEHFDEKLDDFLNKFSSGIIMPKYVGPRTFVNDNRTFFRAYFYDEQVFKMLDVEYKIKPIITEIRRLYEILILQLENGSRF
jgi:hypothetical protein